MKIQIKDKTLILYAVVAIILIFTGTNLNAQQYTLTDNDVTVNNGVIESCSYDFTIKDIIIPDVLDGQTVTGISDGGVFSQKGIAIIQLPNTLEYIGSNAFLGNELTNLAMPNSVTEIGFQAFHANKLENVILSNNLISIADWSFSYNNLTTLTIPESVSNIGFVSFAGNNLTNITIPNTVKTIDIEAFAGNNLTSVILEENSLIQSIGMNAFSNNSGLTSIALPTNANFGFVEYEDGNGNTYNPGENISDFLTFYESVIELTPLQTDSLVLVDLYNATNGPNWSNNNNWLISPVNEWFGVIVDNGRVVEIGLNMNNLNGTLPVEIGSLTGLINLELAANNLQDSIPAEIGNLTNLVSLVLEENNLTGAIPSKIENLNNLQNLEISYNQFNGNIPDVFGTLTNLNEFRLNNNEFTGSIPVSIKSANNLMSFYVGNNLLEGIIPQELCDLPYLNYVDFSNNNFRVESCPTIQCLKDKGVYFEDSVQLQENGFSLLKDCKGVNSEMTYVPNDNFEKALIEMGYDSGELNDSVPTANIIGVKTLIIIDRWITDLTGIEDFIALETLMCQNLQLTSLDVSQNTALTFLDCGMNQLKNLDLSQNSSLEHLACFYNQLTNLDVSNNTALTSLYCYSNQLVNLDISSNIALENLQCQSCELTSLDVSNNTAVTNLFCYSNKLTFESLEPAINIEKFTCSPQDSIGFKIDTIAFVETDFSYVLETGGSANQYQWYKDDVLLPSQTTDTLKIDSVSYKDTGAYTCQVNNTLVKGLTLTSRPINLNIREPTPLQRDSLSLVTLYNATDGPNWTNNENWLTGHLSTWFGIQIDDGRVWVIDLKDNNLDGQLPKEMAKLMELYGLNLSNNLISGSIPKELGELSNLDYINLSNNQFSGNLPLELGSLNATHILLSNNNLSGEVPIEITNNQNLWYFFINDNELDSLPDLSALPSLLEFDCRNNKFTFEDLEPNVGVSSSFYYSPQDSIGLEIDTTLAENQDFQYHLEVGGEHNLYQWFKDGVLLAGQTSDTLKLTNLTLSDSGEYFCKVTNSIATELTLTSKLIHVEILTNTVPTDKQVSSTTLSSGETDCFNATNTITIAGDGTQVIVESGASANFIAGQSIRFLPGFHAQEGSYTHGYITETGDYCIEAAPAIVAAETTTKEAVVVDAELTEIAEREMVVYPNPNSGEFTVEFRNFEDEIRVMLFNSIGQLVQEELTTDREIRMNVPNLKSGMYFIKAVNKGEQFNQKIIVR